VDEPNCIKLPESMDVKTASPIFCAGITAFHAVDNSELKEGDWLAVVGAGGLGQQATQIAKAMNFKVVALDVNDATLEVCKKQGADAVFNSKTNKDYAVELKKLTGGGTRAACVFSNADAVSFTHHPVIVS
jgi:alcohol dehydrogenase, propanol-preferring